mgnify:CR=1 FL=1
MKLTGKEIVLGVTGGIAAYKSAEIVSLLRKQGANVHVIMTANATKFIAPLTFETLSANPVVWDTFERPERWEVEHVALAKRAQLLCIAPATANILAKMAWGLADDMLSTTVLATRAPILVAPAMNVNMWEAEATRRNMAALRERGVHVVGPGSGFLACGDSGAGRMAEPEEIVSVMEGLLCPRQDYAGVRVLVTAGALTVLVIPVITSFTRTVIAAHPVEAVREISHHPDELRQIIHEHELERRHAAEAFYEERRRLRAEGRRLSSADWLAEAHNVHHDVRRRMHDSARRVERAAHPDARDTNGPRDTDERP